MTAQVLTDRQRYYLGIIRAAEAAGDSLASAARAADVPVQSLYTLRYQLRRQERQPEAAERGGFQQLAVVADQQPTSLIELRTELRNGQPLWLNVPAGELATVLQALNA